MELSTDAVAVTTLDVVPDSKGADKSGLQDDVFDDGTEDDNTCRIFVRSLIMLTLSHISNDRPA